MARFGERTRPSTQVSNFLPQGAFNVALLSPSLWLDASDASTITSSGSPAKVSQWNNKGSVSANFSQATSSAQPTTGSETQNGNNVLVFSGAQYFTSTDQNAWKFLHDGTKYFICIACNPSSSSRHNLLANSNGSLEVGMVAIAESSSGLLFVQYNGSDFGGIYTDTNLCKNARSSGVYQVYSFFSDATNSVVPFRLAMQVNASGDIRPNERERTASTSNPTRNLVIGASAALASPMTGRIAEIVVVKGTNATIANRNLTIAYLSDKWKVS